MKTVKEISKLTGVSIRTLRYYDEIGLLKPTHLTDAGYREYDNKALEKLQLIMFFRELELSLADVKKILDDDSNERQQILSAQKLLLETKRNRLNGIIELIDDVMKGVNTMNFEAFNDDDIKKIMATTEENMTPEMHNKIIEQFGSYDAYKEAFASNIKDEKTNSDIVRWFGGKEKAIENMAKPVDDLASCQEENKRIYEELYKLKDKDSIEEERPLIERLATCYKQMFNLDNARALLLDLANEYLTNAALRDANDQTYGQGSAVFTAKAIKRYYGEN